MYNGYVESQEAIEARKRRILATPNLAADEIPPAGECSPMYYAAMTPAQRAEYDKRLDAFLHARYAALKSDGKRARRQLVREAAGIWFTAVTIALVAEAVLIGLQGR